MNGSESPKRALPEDPYDNSLKSDDTGQKEADDPSSDQLPVLSDESKPEAGIGTPGQVYEPNGKQRNFLSTTLVIVLGAVVVCGCIGWWRGHDMTTYVMFTEPFFTLLAVMIGFYFKSSDE